MKLLLLIVLVIGTSITTIAQENYKISGKIEGMADGTLLLISEERGVVDTLGITPIINEAFEFTGTTDKPIGAYITTTDQQGIIPLILENANFTIFAGTSGVIIQGGFQQEIYNRFCKINTEIIQLQTQTELQLTEQKGNNSKVQTLINQFNQFLENAQAKEKKLLQEYADTYVAAYVIFSSMQQMELETLKGRYSLLGENAKSTITGQAIANLIAQQEKLTEGNVAPDFTIKKNDGNSIVLRNTKGKVKLIHFWASWSIPCRQENISLLKIYQKYHTKGLEIISISLDNNRMEWLKAVGEDGMIWENGSDLNGGESEIARLFFVKNLPHSLLLDENNVIVAKNLRDDALREKIAEQLKGK